MLNDILKKINNLDDEILFIENKITEDKEYMKSLVKKRKDLAIKAADEMIESGCTSADIDGLRFSVRNTPQSVIVNDEKLIPPKYFKEKVTKSVNKVLLKSALKNGASIQGATLSNGGVTIQVKGIK